MGPMTDYSKRQNAVTGTEPDDHILRSVAEKQIKGLRITQDFVAAGVIYHFTGSLSILPSAASSAVKVLPRYCTQSMTRGCVPLSDAAATVGSNANYRAFLNGKNIAVNLKLAFA